MEFREGLSEECGGEYSYSYGGISGVEYKDYDSKQDLIPVLICLHKYWLETHREDKDKYVTLKREDGTEYQISELEVLLYWFLYEEHCKLKVAVHDKKVIGIMIYYYFFESVLIVRGIWFRPDYRKKMLLRGLTHSVGNVSCVISQTYTKHQPKEIKNEKKRRKKLYTNGEFDVWFNDLRKGSFNYGSI